MPSLLWIMIAFLNVFSLTACQSRQQESMAFYLEHPKVLSQEVVACQSLTIAEQSEPHCRLVMDAAGKVMELIEAHQRNPQAYGQRILDAEMAYAKTGQNELEVKTLLAVLGLSSPE